MKLDDMPPGKELDALVAEKVMGWLWNGDMLGPPKGDERQIWATEWDDAGLPGYLPEYSTDIAAAWEVVEHFGHRTRDIQSAQVERTAIGIVIFTITLRAIGTIAARITSSYLLCRACLLPTPSA